MKPIRTTNEMLALCNVERAKRREPVRRLDRLTNAEQRAKWRGAFFLTRWLESRR